MGNGGIVITGNILTYISNNMATFSKGQKLIATFILHSADKAAYMTANKLGKTVGVSESTVVRFAGELGYEGYPEMQSALREIIKQKLTTLERVPILGENLDSKEVLEKVLQQDSYRINRTLEKTSKEDFVNAVEAIISAENIYILGVRSSASLSNFLYFYFNMIFPNAHLIDTQAQGDVFEQMMRIGKNDVFIGISFPRYSKRTVTAMRFAHGEGTKCIALTDGDASPLIPYADHCIFAKSDMLSIVDSLVAPMSILNALIVAVALRQQEELSKNLEKLERIWEEYQVYEKIEEDGE